MFGKLIQSKTSEPSFYYVMLAAACFRRTVRRRHSNAGAALHDIGCKYLARAASGVVHERISEFSLAPAGRAGARTCWRQPWPVN